MSRIEAANERLQADVAAIMEELGFEVEATVVVVSVLNREAEGMPDDPFRYIISTAPTREAVLERPEGKSCLAALTGRLAGVVLDLQQGTPA